MLDVLSLLKKFSLLIPLIKAYQDIMKFSVVIPVYKCSQAITELSSRLIATLNSLTDEFEIIFVNDSSPENEWEIISELAKKEPRIKGLNLSRNFGQHYAITAGLEKATGEWVVIMDGDLQDHPEEVINLYNKSQEGYEVVSARRVMRNDKLSKKLFSAFFYKLFGYLTDVNYDNTIANFGIYHRNVIDSLLLMKDRVRVFPILLQWVGFKRVGLEVKHNERPSGESSYNYKKLFKLAFDIIISFSNKPLLLMVRVGFLISILSFIMGLFYIYKYATGQILISGFTSLILSIWFLSGLILISIGVLGVYISKIFDSSKQRPLYITKDSIGF